LYILSEGGRRMDEVDICTAKTGIMHSRYNARVNGERKHEGADDPHKRLGTGMGWRSDSNNIH
jgi:hypothetical protein